jgi:ribosome biogenesis GTPase A
LKKYFIIVLNKVDLVDAPVVLAWKKYFEQEYPSIHVVLFTSCPAYNLRGNSQNKTGLKIRRRRGRMRMASEGALQVYQACHAIVKDQVDLSNWQRKIQDEMVASSQVDEEDDEDEPVKYDGTHEEVKDFDFEKHELYKNGTLTVGCVGFPNVGKSSLLNALMGKKVVSVSRTPGHTKHFQTIFLTNTVRLCDCPGLVFPSQVPRSLQVLMGSYPIAQLREPYASIRFLAERLDIPNLLAMQHPEGKGEEWSAMDICDAFAIKRGFYTGKKKNNCREYLLIVKLNNKQSSF